MSRYKNIVFDVGSVLVNWMRMNLYTTLFHGDREKAKWIIDHVVTNEWNDQTDLGKPIDECIFELKQAFPKYAPYIGAYWYCYKDMDGGEIPGIYEIMSELKNRGYHLFCLTNWSHETFPLVREVHARIIRKTKCYRFTKRNVPKHKTKRLRYRCPPEPYSNSVRTDFFSYSNAIILESQQINTSI